MIADLPFRVSDLDVSEPVGREFPRLLMAAAAESASETARRLSWYR